MVGLFRNAECLNRSQRIINGQSCYSAYLVGVRRKLGTLKQEGLDFGVIFDKILGHFSNALHHFIDIDF